MGSRMPFLEPVEEAYSEVQLTVAIAIMALGLVGIIAYLRWKLPRADQLEDLDRAPEEGKDEPPRP